ncbi:MAG: hypothetical protein JJU32_07460 [Phormidium sp. BM_Day4_Bin.17]|nr:hypothetical protein [Phormidium sp. BM_Day4_Bin.17]UCJ12613.1 MAG: hypothetical protein JWS08_01975 [Phormidium sp. PBR-2020]
MTHSDRNLTVTDDRKRYAHEIYQEESRQVLKSVTNILAVDLMWSLVGLKS